MLMCKEESNIKMSFTEIGLESVGRNHLNRASVASSCEHGNRISGSLKGRELLKYSNCC
jgi:hypothetical protein